MSVLQLFSSQEEVGDGEGREVKRRGVQKGWEKQKKRKKGKPAPVKPKKKLSAKNKNKKATKVSPCTTYSAVQVVISWC